MARFLQETESLLNQKIKERRLKAYNMFLCQKQLQQQQKKAIYDLANQKYIFINL